MDRPAMLIESIFERIGTDPQQGGLCLPSAHVLEGASLGISLISGSTAGPVCSSDDFSEKLEDLQYELREGPSYDAFRGGEAVLEQNLAGSVPSKWTAFSPPALALGLRAVFAFPLKEEGTVPFGSLTVYRHQLGPLSEKQHVLAPVLAQLLSEKMLEMQGQADPGSLPEALAEAADHLAEVHQAAGMLAVRMGVAVEEAAIRLRAYCYSVDRPLSDVARDVVMDRLSLPADLPDSDSR